MPIINSVIAAQATENLTQVLKNNTVSYCGITPDASSHSVITVPHVLKEEALGK